MRVFEDGIELHSKCLGLVDIAPIVSQITSLFDLTDSEFETIEPIFRNSYRIVGKNSFFTKPQLYSKADRKQELVDIVQPLMVWLAGIYPNHIPVLIQCATLPVGNKLGWHVDTYMYQNVSHKIHFPLISHENAFYESYDSKNQLKRSNFEVGKAYEINNIYPHRSVNYGPTIRTHIIIDMMDQNQLDAFVSEGVNFHHTHHPENKPAETAWLRSFGRSLL